MVHVLQKPQTLFISRFCFSREQQRNVQRSITHVHSHCSAEYEVSTHYLVKPEAHPLVKLNLAEKRLLKVLKLAQQHDKYTKVARENDFLTLFFSSLFLTFT